MEKQKDPSEVIEKYDIKLKSKPKDGVILQLHHTIRGPNGETRRIRFSTASFDDNHEKLACSDGGGNIFILDFADLKFWKLTGIGVCSALHFLPNMMDILVVATTSNFEICFLDVESGVATRRLAGHTAAVKHISYSNSKTCNLLTASPVEAILWELTTYTKFFTLNTYLGAQIQHILFTPGGDFLVACFQNNTVQIWRHESMKSVKQIIPSDLKHMKCLAFTMNGRAMAMSGLTPTLIIFSMDTWKALKSIDLTKYNITAAQQVAFIPQVFDGGANKVLAILSNDCILYFLDMESQTIIHSIVAESSGIKRFVVSPTGKYFVCILQLGEVNIYKTSHVLEMAHSPVTVEVRRTEMAKKEAPSTSMHRDQTAFAGEEKKFSPSKFDVEQKMRTCMDSARLRRILMQYGEYPVKFRSVIWRSLLNTPRNRSGYTALVEKGIHRTYRDIERQFTIHSTATLKNLKRLLSCLAHWCPLFAVMKFLPGFVFPFVKVLQKDPLLLFECVATVLLNHCQLWFEYAPFPPISILAMIENILAEHDQQLLDHFCEIGVTSQTYALKILETAFSEVLTCSEWLILWDHILSNEPAFILMAVVSYNIVQRNAIKKLKTHEQIEDFFHMQNAIDKKTFLKKAYTLLNETPDDIHPRKFFNPFVSLEKGETYQQFTGYPKATICLKLAKKERKKSAIKYTLRELTTKSQERFIEDRAKNENPAECISVHSEDDSDDDGTDRPGRQHKHSKGDCQKAVKEQLIEGVMFPGEHVAKPQPRCSKKDNPKSSRSRSKSNKTSHDPNDKRHESLEKEVEKLMISYSNSEQSDT